jgi:hypothetical protein
VCGQTNEKNGQLTLSEPEENNMTYLALVSRATATFLVATLVVLSNQIYAGDSLRPKEVNRRPQARILTLKGEFITAVQVIPPFPSFPPEPFQPILHLLITATGKLSHFGKATAATTDQAVDLSVIPNKGKGLWVFQNSRGDAIWTETDMSSTPLDATGRTEFYGVLTVIGGTGDFKGATGTLEFRGSAEGDVGFFTVNGTIRVSCDDQRDRGDHPLVN